MEPFWAAAVKFSAYEETCAFNSTLCFRLSKRPCKILSKLPDMSFCSNLNLTTSCEPFQKAFEKNTSNLLTAIKWFVISGNFGFDNVEDSRVVLRLNKRSYTVWASAKLTVIIFLLFCTHIASLVWVFHYRKEIINIKNRSQRNI